MKRYLSLILVATLAVSLVACEKDENKIFLEGGTSPSLTASSTAPMVLLDANKANFAIRFNWTNPNYRFTTGVSSQDVTYYLQVDTTGANFTNPNMQQVSVSKDLEVSFTVKEFNAIFSKLDVKENMPHNIDIRIKATINGAAPLYSNVIKMVVTPYLDVAVPIPAAGDDLYMTGNAMPSDWTNSPPAAQKLTKVSVTEYYWVGALTPGKQYKILSKPGNWQPQWGAAPGSGYNGNGGDMAVNLGGGSDPDAIPTPTDAGNYKVTINFKTGKYSVVKQ